MTQEYRKKLIEVALPLEAINEEGARRKRKAPKGFPTTIHSWWAQRPLAAVRGVLFGQLVDDPSAWPERFPSEAAQERERNRLFRILAELVKWDNSNNELVINAARLEIARSWARNHPSPKASRVLADDVSPGEVDDFLATELPAVHDPFAGGGTIPLEARRLGLQVIASDLNPVAVLINKALIEIPARFAGQPPVNPEGRKAAGMGVWTGAQNLAADVRYYGQWMRDEAYKRIGHLYPQVNLPKEYGGGKATVIAWLWARTVASPNPALGGAEVPLISSFWLSTKAGKETWVEPILTPDGRSYRFEIRTGKPKDRKAIDAGTKLSRGANFRCLLSGVPIGPDYIKAEGMAGRMGARLMAIAVEGKRGRIYLPPSDDQEVLARNAQPEWAPEQELPDDPRNFWTVQYGLKTFGDLFTPRQLVALTTFSDLVQEARARAIADAKESGIADDGVSLHEGGTGATAIGDSLAVYLSMALSRVADYGSALATWRPKDNAMRSSLPRQALAMTWDYSEGNPFGSSSSGFIESVDVVSNCLMGPALATRSMARAQVSQADAQSADFGHGIIISTDPPYYDNIGYADLSDFFYVWLRRSLRSLLPSLFGTMLAPKQTELVANPYRHGGRVAADRFFQEGTTQAIRQMTSESTASVPVAIYYAFKQEESQDDAGAPASTGWEKFLQGVLDGGFGVTGTWPLRTEGDNRQNAVGANALASSVVLVCRKRDPRAPTLDRRDFRRALRKELPDALKALQHGNIAPVDVAQAAIGPGMAIFSRYSKVFEADGSTMSVRSALQLINEVLDEYLSALEGESDAETRFAITWYEQYSWNTGKYGDAETLAKARNVAVSGIAEAGILHSAAGKVRLLKRTELPPDWDPAVDRRLTVWEATQHLIKRLEETDEQTAAELLRRLGPVADKARDLAYRLYSTCERRGWAEDARAYNGLVVAWPELEKLAATVEAPRRPEQATFL